MAIDWLLLSFCIAGGTIHFLSRWGVFFRTTDAIGPIAYARKDPPAWILAALCAVLSYWLLPELAQFAGYQAALTPLWALVSGYSLSSLGGKLLEIVAPKIAGSR